MSLLNLLGEPGWVPHTHNVSARAGDFRLPRGISTLYRAWGTCHLMDTKCPGPSGTNTDEMNPTAKVGLLIWPGW